MIIYNEKEARWKYKFYIASVSLELWKWLLEFLECTFVSSSGP
jgi:hypothetical protein